MDKQKIYNSLPIWAQNAACCVEGYRIKRTRYGKTFWELLAEYQSHNSWSYEQLCDYRDAKLRKMIKHCYETVPYYTKLFNDGGINYESIKTLDDLKCLPVLTKQTINENINGFISSAVPEKKMVSGHTSGTTGSGFIFKTTNEALCDQWAACWRYRINLGIEYGTLHALFGSKLIVPTSQIKPPYWRYIKPDNRIYFSAFHERDENLQHYYNEITKRNITWIHGFPSLISLLASYMVKNGLSLKDKIQYVTLGAENLLENQESVIVKAFGVKPYNHYNMAENVANFSQDRDYIMKVDEDFAAVEFIDADLNLQSNTKKIIGTCLSNYAMPLIRYDTNDLCVVEECNDGRYVSSLDGRTEDYITLCDGTKIGKLDHMFKDTPGIIEAQLYQHSDYSVTAYAVKNKKDMKEEENEVLKQFQASTNGSLKIRFEYVDKIPRTKGGKLRFVVSEIDAGKRL